MNRSNLDLLLSMGPEGLAKVAAELFDEQPCSGGCGTPVTQRKNTLASERLCDRCLGAGRQQTGMPKNRGDALAWAGVPARYRKPFMDRMWPAAVNNLDVIVWDWSGDPWAVGFLGEPGSGKTHLATELFWRMLQRTRSGAWLRAEELVNALYGNLGDDRLKEAVESTNAKLLMIDDFGWGVQGGAIEKLFGVINHRYGHMLPTIWTTNNKLVDFASGPTGAALTRRLQEGLLVPVKGNWRAALTAGDQP